MLERTDIRLTATDRRELEAVVANRNSSQKYGSRARIVLPTADGHGAAHAGHRQGQDGDLAVGGTVWRGRRGEALAPQDSALAHCAAEPRGGRKRPATLAGPPSTASHWTGRRWRKARI
jgi:hypothetical protein